ncbi:MAG: replication initiator [Actinomycetes bacterium]
MTSSLTATASAAPVLDFEQVMAHLGDGLARQAPEKVSRWVRRMASVGTCVRPIRLQGSTVTRDAYGRVLSRFSSADEPDGVLLKACGDRRASRCEGCAYTYRGDAWQLIASGLRGGKGVPESAAAHPRVFLTVTAPSFGPVHTQRVSATGLRRRCQNRRKDQVCAHGRPVRCLARHADDDERLGTPICPDCYDHESQVLFNALAGELWRRTTIYLTRALADQTGISYRRLHELVRIRHVKVAEYQARGVVHFHAILRVDAHPTDDQPGPCPPPQWVTGHDLTHAARVAVAKVRVPLPAAARTEHRSSFGWGRQVDVHEITRTPDSDHPDTETAETAEPGELSEAKVAAYVSKYATKSTEACGGADRPVYSEKAIDYTGATEHAKALMRTCWHLGGREGLEHLRLRAWAHTLGFRGHFTTKSHAYSTTFTALREARHTHARDHSKPFNVAMNTAHPGPDRGDRPEPDALDDPDPVGEYDDPYGDADDPEATTLIINWRYAGRGYTRPGDALAAAYLANGPHNKPPATITPSAGPAAAPAPA